MRSKARLSHCSRIRALWSLVVLVVLMGCRGNEQRPSSEEERPSREDCTRLADHLAELIIESFRTDPDRLWEAIDGPSAASLPDGVTKETFPQFLASEPGKALLEAMRAKVREETGAAIDSCVVAATRQQIDCSLGAKNRADIDECDRIHAP